MRFLLPLLFSCAHPSPPEALPEPAALNKPPLDDRAYRLVTTDNGLTALVISDPDTDMAAAALTVGVGQFSDPDGREGLAHFLEHMLFIGTDQYPQVDAYREFITNHGGRSNASTNQESTQYYFTIEHGYLDGALDRFARFFIAPLLDPEYVARERNAVNSEYRLKVQSEARRFREVRRQTSNPAHGFAGFSVGDLETLGDRDDDTVWAALEAFYRAEYSASRMTLAVLGRQDLDTLEEWVVERFSAVPTTGEPPAVQQVPPFLDDQLGVQINVVPLTEVRRLHLELPVPPQEAHFAEHPLDLLIYLLGQEGEGSLHAALNARGWITALRSGQDGATDFGLLTLDVDLTEEGYDHIDEVVDLCFDAIRLIGESGDLSPWWEERRAVSALAFRFSEPASPRGAVTSATSRLQTYPPEHVLDAWATWSQYDPALQQDYLSRLTPENLRLFVVAPDLPTDRIEERYQVPWSIAPIEPEQLAAWSSGPIDAALTMPAHNPYLAEDLTLLPDTDAPPPTLLIDEDGLQLWHRPDASFGVPRATVRAVLIAPAATADVEARITTGLLAGVISDAISPLLDQLSNVGLTLSLWQADEGLLLQVRGYNDKQAQLLTEVLPQLRDITVDPERFAIVRDEWVRQWRNTDRGLAINQASWALNEVLDPTDFSYAEGVEHLLSLTPESLQAFADDLFDVLSVQVLVHGNVSAQEATDMARTIHSILAADATPAPRTPKAIRRAPAGKELVRDMQIHHADSALRILYQGQRTDIDEQARYLMLGTLIESPFFTELRTNQQLGYIVYAGYSRYDRVPGLMMGIQSSVADVQTLQAQVDAFLIDYATTLEQLDEATFAESKQGLIAYLLEQPTDLYDLTEDYARDLDLGYTSFDRVEQLVHALEPLTLQDIRDHFAQRILSEDAGRLVVRATGEGAAAAAPAEPGCQSNSCIIDALDGVFLRTR